MTTEWWNDGSQETDTQAREPYSALPPISAFEAPSSPPPDPPKEGIQEPKQGQDEPESRNGARSKAMVAVGAAAAAVVAVLVIHGVSQGGGSSHEDRSASAPTKQSEDLPAAGGGPEKTVPAGSRLSTRQGQVSQSAAPKVVTLDAAPSGRGRVGAVVKVTIHNGTDDPLTVLAAMVKGDGRPAVVGEGTLAPGSRTVQPGETAEGTVEFTTAAVPHQVALLDLSGRVVAASS